MVLVGGWIMLSFPLLGNKQARTTKVAPAGRDSKKSIDLDATSEQSSSFRQHNPYVRLSVCTYHITRTVHFHHHHFSHRMP